MKKLAIVSFVFALSLAAMAQAPSTRNSSPTSSTTQKPELLPGKEVVDAAMQRTLGYDPNLTWQIYDIRQSGIPDVADIVVSINKRPSAHPAPRRRQSL